LQRTLRRRQLLLQLGRLSVLQGSMSYQLVATHPRMTCCWEVENETAIQRKPNRMILQRSPPERVPEPPPGSECLQTPALHPCVRQLLP
jgi:hypothetical protein